MFVFSVTRRPQEGSTALVAVAALLFLVGCGTKPAPSHGVEIVMRVIAADGKPASAADTERGAGVMRQRLRELHVSVNVRRQGQSLIVLRLAGASLATLPAEIGPPRFEMYDLVPALVSPSVTADGQVVAYRSRSRLLAAARRLGSAGFPERTIVVSCSAATTTVCPGDADGLPPAGQGDYYLFKHGAYPGDPYATDGRYPNLTGADLEPSSIRQDFDPATGTPIVLFSFDHQGNQIFKQVTKAEAMRGRRTSQSPCGATCAFAIVLDDRLYSWPAIDPTQNPQGIDPTGTGVQIAGLGSVREARSVALALQAGALPFQFVEISRRAYER